MYEEASLGDVRTCVINGYPLKALAQVVMGSRIEVEVQPVKDLPQR
jgi:hypothetical protein